MNDWSEKLNTKAGGTLELSNVPLPAELAELEAQGFFVATLDRAPVFNKDTLMHAAYQACIFPAYFGFNWDALADCFSDFSWLENNKGVVLVYQNPNLLREEDPASHALFLQTVHDANASLHAASALPLWLLLVQKNSVSNL